MGEAIDRTDPKLRDAMVEALAEAVADYQWERLLADDGRLSWTVRGAFKDSEGSLRRSLRETLRSEAAPEPWIDEGVALRVGGRLSRRLLEGEWTPVCATFVYVGSEDSLKCTALMYRRPPTASDTARCGSPAKWMPIPHRRGLRRFRVCVTETFSNVYEVELPAGTADEDVVSRVEEMCNAGEMSPAGDSDSEYGRKVVMA